MLRLLAILLCAISTTYACSCVVQHPQQAYCRSAFVLRARVIAVRVDNPTMHPIARPGVRFNPKELFPRQVYTLRITKIFKGHEQVRNNSRYDKTTRTLELYTPHTLSSCQINLQTNNSYLIGGWISSKRLLKTDLCSLIKKWTRVTLEERQMLRNYYQPNCQCKVKECRLDSNYKCEQRNKNNVCEFHYDDFRCTAKHRFCKLDSDSGTCNWSDLNDRFTECVAKLAN